MRTKIDNIVKINGNSFTNYDKAIEYIETLKKKEYINIYNCDYCGKKCQHSPQYVLPVFEPVEASAIGGGVKLATFTVGEMINKKQRDICPECQKKLAVLASLIPHMDILGNG